MIHSPGQSVNGTNELSQALEKPDESVGLESQSAAAQLIALSNVTLPENAEGPCHQQLRTSFENNASPSSSIRETQAEIESVPSEATESPLGSDSWFVDNTLNSLFVQIFQDTGEKMAFVYCKCPPISILPCH